MLTAILIIIALGVYAWLYEAYRKQQESAVGSVVYPAVKKVETLDPVRVAVTYPDGTSEIFQTKDGEVDLMDDGTVTFRTDNGRCITLSPKNYRKLEETHLNS